MDHDRSTGSPAPSGQFASATVVTSNVNRAAREHAEADRYDVVLDVFVDGSAPRRVHLSGVELGPMLPMIGSTVTVRLAEPIDEAAAWADSLEIIWRGDPNLDVDAHRRQLAELAESARRRHERSQNH